MIRFAIFGLALAAAVPAKAGDERSAKDLAKYCGSDSGPELVMCMAYTAGFADGISAGVASTLDLTLGKVCIPTNINGAIASLIAKKFLRDNPDVLAESAKTALTVAMWRAYPCK
ncbi:hypothetical protein J2R76_005801 [Bradyrhizobium sp. USDA 4532]|uniref:Rap1a/Tai family immunity protein n=1 Tax=unclassified Bradyrhizobium TaxID=2631580 RepID=UPI00209F8F45|nr:MULTISPECIES: Rap1a/Tai family immunity protein [unclassified Bradyrhizobium]MCP1829101.1 hypothetical protein [Bradyrhizobium sp. USDA 4545]MCP1922210.1 hypothetical protein [Bradyrhizobium sp. USDA 4532]